MSIKIEIKIEDAKDLIDFYVEKQRNIKAQISVLDISLKEINSRILELKQILKDENNEEKKESDNQIYSPKWSWVKKIEFALQKAAKPLTTKEIVDMLTDYDPSYISTRKTAIASVSATLSSKSGPYDHHKDFIKIPSDWGDYTYEIWKERVIEPPKEIPEEKGEDLDLFFSNYISSDPSKSSTSDNDDFPF